MFGALQTLVTSRAMYEWIDQASDMVATAAEVVMVIVIVIGSVRAIAAIARLLAARQALAPAVRQIWLHYAAWILLALEFALAADLVRTAVAPTWDDISKLAVIATIRTMLNYFLAKDIAEFDQARQSGGNPPSGQTSP